jgi:hypothetical protein
MKRRRTTDGSLTGGTGDVNPQLFSGFAATTVADTPHTTAFITPISRLPKSGGKATVMEVLKVYTWIAPLATGAAAETIQVYTAAFGTKDYGNTTNAYADNPTLFAYHQYQLNGAFTAATCYKMSLKMPLTMDLTDNQGHGILVASDYIYIQVDTAGIGQTVNVYFKILYRFKNVSLTEYVGIVQSQQ